MKTKARKIDVKTFKANLYEAFERNDIYVPEKDIETFLQLNWFDCDEGREELSSWSLADFLDFASDICAEWGDFWEVVRQWDLRRPNCPEEEDN